MIGFARVTQSPTFFISTTWPLNGHEPAADRVRSWRRRTGPVWLWRSGRRSSSRWSLASPEPGFFRIERRVLRSCVSLTAPGSSADFGRFMFGLGHFHRLVGDFDFGFVLGVAWAARSSPSAMRCLASVERVSISATKSSFFDRMPSSKSSFMIMPASDAGTLLSWMSVTRPRSTTSTRRLARTRARGTEAAGGWERLARRTVFAGRRRRIALASHRSWSLANWETPTWTTAWPYPPSLRWAKPSRQAREACRGSGQPGSVRWDSGLSACGGHNGEDSQHDH